jgi:hypothetical protein
MSHTCPKFGDRVAVDLLHGATLYGRSSGCVFGDPTAPHEHFVYVDTAIWADGTVVRTGSGRAGKHWGVRPLTDAEQAREQREHDYALSLVD